MSINSFQIEPGRTISHFRLEKLLGEGGMGAVYLAEDLTLSRRVAIKFMRREMLAALPSPEQRQKIELRFIREAKSAASINHANIAQIYEADFETDNWYIAMEYIDGKALDEYLGDDGPLPAQRALEILEQAILGLEYAWDSYKIVHRDIKPQNIMLTKRGQVKIVDLGLAKPIVENSEEDLELTGAGVPIGTPYYMAPEQASGGEVNQQTDIFALGATVYELLSGKKCFQGKTAPMIYNKQVNKDYLPLTDFGIPQNLSSLIDKMIEPNQEARYSDYNKLLSDVKTLQAQRHSGDSTAMMKTVDASIAGTIQPLSKSIYGTSITGGVVDNMQTIVNIFYPIDYKILDRYQVLEIIRQGNTGIVYLCMDTQLERECSVKCIKAGREYNADEFVRIKNNYINLSGKKHENLVEILDLHETDDGNELLIVMELLQGQDFLEYTNNLYHQNDSFNIDTISGTLTKIAQALDSVSKDYQISHNDLKPVSIFILDDQSIKLLDYGVTYLSPTKDDKANASNIWKYPIANPDYMSPELWAHKKTGTASDQYSFAVIIYEIISHKLPFWIKDRNSTADNSDNMEGLLEKQFNRVSKTTPATISFLSNSQNTTMLRAMAKSPQERFPSCEVFIQNLTGKKKGLKPILLAVAALVLIGFAYTGYTMRQNSKATASFGISQKCTELLQKLNGHTDLQSFQDQMTQAKTLQDSKKYEQAKLSYEATYTKLSKQYNDTVHNAVDTIVIAKMSFNKKVIEIDGITDNEISKQTLANLSWPDYENISLDQLKKILENANDNLSTANEVLRIAQAAQQKNLTDINERITVLASLWAENISDGTKEKVDFDKHLASAQLAAKKNGFDAAQSHLSQAEDFFKSVQQSINQKYKSTFEKAEAKLTALKSSSQKILYFLEDGQKMYDQMIEQDKTWQEYKLNKQYQQASVAINRQINALEVFNKQLQTTAKDAFILQIQNDQQACVKLTGSLTDLKELVPKYASIASDSKKGHSFLTEKKYMEAGASYKALKTKLTKMKDELHSNLKKKVAELNIVIIEMTDRLEKGKTLNNQINFVIDEFEVNYSLARANKAERKYLAAYQEFKKLIIKGKEIEALIKSLSKPLQGKNWNLPKINMKFVWVKQMKMWVGQYEVTNGEFRKFKPAFKNDQFGNGKTLNSDRQPASILSYNDATAFCKWLTKKALIENALPKKYCYRLPSRKEWIMFATAGNPEFKYPFGNKWPPPANGPNYAQQKVPGKEPDWKNYEDKFQLTAPVEKSFANKWNIFGTGGNVWEWSSESEGESQAIFGGSWSTYNQGTLTTNPPNNFAPKTSSYNNIGFRVILAPLPVN
jgi:serine/threonine protein kinase